MKYFKYFELMKRIFRFIQSKIRVKSLNQELDQESMLKSSRVLKLYGWHCLHKRLSENVRRRKNP